jgi:Cu(I)/Ag(I) efflux system membrane protein CusA/SilA
MTVATMMIGLVPLLWSQGAGADVMKRVAAPMVGGLFTSAFLTLEIIPVVYTWWRWNQFKRGERGPAARTEVRPGAAPIATLEVEER